MRVSVSGGRRMTTSCGRGGGGNEFRSHGGRLVYPDHVQHLRGEGDRREDFMQQLEARGLGVRVVNAIDNFSKDPLHSPNVSCHAAEILAVMNRALLLQVLEARLDDMPAERNLW